MLRSAAKIDVEGLARKAKSSEHNEAYQKMWEQDRIRIGAGARFTTQDGTAFFIEVVVPIYSGSQVDLEAVEGKLEILRRLEEEGFSLNCHDDMSFSCELVTRKNDVENQYTRVVSLVERSHAKSKSGSLR